MAKQELEILAFNRGLISQLALARVDLKRSALSAEVMTNWMPRALGSMMLRAGRAYLGNTASNAASRFMPFVFATSDTALLEFTNAALRIWISDTLLTRPAVSTAITNGTFAGNITNWTDASDVGATTNWNITYKLLLTGTGSARAIAYQTVTVVAADQNVEHALRIVIYNGPVTLRVGSTVGNDDYVAVTVIDTGTHSIAFTPSGNFTVQFESAAAQFVGITSCTVEAAGVVSLPSPYLAADLDNISGGADISQSADILYLACSGYQQRKIERRGTHPGGRSWSVALYRPPDGPFRTQNTGPITMTPSTLTGNGTLTASRPYFKSTHVGALFRVASSGQNVTASIAAANTFSNSVRITGVGLQRTFFYSIAGTWVGTVTVQTSPDNATWTDYSNTSVNTGAPISDGLDNQVIYYRIGIKAGNYTSGTALIALAYTQGSVNGICRVTALTTNVLVSIEVLAPFGNVTANSLWWEGQWSDYRGWPSAGGFYEGRLWWAGKNGIGGSISDAFDSYDDSVEGDSGTINRSIGTGPVDRINWLLPLQRLLLGGEGAEFSVRSTAFDEPLTPSNFNIKPCSTQGSAPVIGVKVDNHGMYVQRGGTRLFELAFANDGGYDYTSTDLTLLIPEIGGDIATTTHIVRIAVQRQPDTRIHCVRSDGIAVVLVYDKAENVLCWVKVDTPGASGLIEDVVVLPSQSGQREDQVYYVVKRTVNGSTVRFLEKWALESECLGGTLNKQADAYIQFTNAAASVTVTGLTHLIGATVICWADGICPEDSNGDIKTYVVSGAGTITLDTAASSGIVGLAYTGSWQGAKLGQSLTHRKQIGHLGVILANTHFKGVKFGPSLTDSEMDALPLMDEGYPVAANTIYSTFDREPIPFPGTWSTDSRLCLKAAAPRPCTILAAVIDAEVT